MAGLVQGSPARSAHTQGAASCPVGDRCTTGAAVGNVKRNAPAMNRRWVYW